MPVLEPDDPRARRAQPFNPQVIRSRASRYENVTPQMMHRCFACDAPRVTLLDCQRRDDRTFQLHVHCPDCGWSNNGTHTTEQLAALADADEDGHAALLATLKRLEAHNRDERVADELARTDWDLPNDW